MDKLFEEKFLEKYFNIKATLITQTEIGMSFERKDDKEPIEITFKKNNGLVFADCSFIDDYCHSNMITVEKEDVEKLIKLGYKI